MKKQDGITVEIPDAIATLFEASPRTLKKATQPKTKYNPENDPEFVASYLKLEFVEELRNAMAELGITGSELARRTGKSRQAVSQALDKTDPDNFTIEKMAELVTAIGARISIKIHEPGTVVITQPIQDLKPRQSATRKVRRSEVKPVAPARLTKRSKSL